MPCFALMCASESLGEFVKTETGPHSEFSLRRGPRICISRNFPGDADVASPGIFLLIENANDKKN